MKPKRPVTYSMKELAEAWDSVVPSKRLYVRTLLPASESLMFIEISEELRRIARRRKKVENK